MMLLGSAAPALLQGHELSALAAQLLVLLLTRALTVITVKVYLPMQSALYKTNNFKSVLHSPFCTYHPYIYCFSTPLGSLYYNRAGV